MVCEESGGSGRGLLLSDATAGSSALARSRSLVLVEATKRARLVTDFSPGRLLGSWDIVGFWGSGQELPFSDVGFWVGVGCAGTRGRVTSRLLVLVTSDFMAASVGMDPDEVVRLVLVLDLAWLDISRVSLATGEGGERILDDCVQLVYIWG